VVGNAAAAHQPKEPQRRGGTEALRVYPRAGSTVIGEHTRPAGAGGRRVRRKRRPLKRILRFTLHARASVRREARRTVLLERKSQLVTVGGGGGQCSGNVVIVSSLSEAQLAQRSPKATNSKSTPRAHPLKPKNPRCGA